MPNLHIQDVFALFGVIHNCYREIVKQGHGSYYVSVCPVCSELCTLRYLLLMNSDIVNEALGKQMIKKADFYFSLGKDGQMTSRNNTT